MPKHNQTKSLGSLTNFQSAPPPPPETETDRITALEKRVSTLEGLLNDVMHQLDKPNTQPKSKRNGDRKAQKSKPPTPKSKEDTPKKTPPSEIITALLKQTPHSRAEIEAETDMDTEAVKKCISWMRTKNFVEKIKEKDEEGNSRWRLKTNE